MRSFTPVEIGRGPSRGSALAASSSERDPADARLPGQLDQPVEVAAHHVGLGTVGVHALEPTQLLERLGRAPRRSIPRVLDLRAVLVHLFTGARRSRRARAWIARKLLAQEVLPLAARHLVVRLRLDLGLDGGDVELAAEQRVHACRRRASGSSISRISWASFHACRLQVRRDEIGELTGITHVGRHRQHLGRQIACRGSSSSTRDPAPCPHEGLGLDAPLVGRILVGIELRYARPGGARAARPGTRCRALAEPLHQHLHPAIGHAQHAHHRHDGADPMEVRPARGARCPPSRWAVRQEQAIARRAPLPWPRSSAREPRRAG